MKRTTVMAALLAALLAATTRAGMKLAEDSELRFATVEEGREALLQEDEYVRSLGPFDLALRLRTNKNATREQYLKLLGDSIRAWTETEKKKLRDAFGRVAPEIQGLTLPFPKKVLLVKATGRAELGRAYTRSNVVVIHRNSLDRPPAHMGLSGLLAHELFHVLSRANPDLRHRLYRAIGFRRCKPVRLPPNIRPRRITNPDGFRNNYCIEVKLKGSTRWAMPIVYSRTEEYDPARGHSFGDYVRFRLLLLERADGASDGEPMSVHPLGGADGPRLVKLRAVSGYLEKTGKNTGYIIHPDEILAENFRLLLTHPRSVRSPDVLENIAEILRTSGSSPPAEEGQGSRRLRHNAAYAARPAAH